MSDIQAGSTAKAWLGMVADIDRLQAENDKLREALKYISDNSSDYDGGWCGIKARQALAGGE